MYIRIKQIFRSRENLLYTESNLYIQYILHTYIYEEVLRYDYNELFIQIRCYLYNIYNIYIIR